ncbi:MAG: type I restriction-modification system subunit M [Candidatus Omnitrophica bacterium]|nr:type I restriction-modification system subunit M [Candidatus Omnitrophota bacterium]
MTINFKERANFIWSIADLLRGDYKQSEYGRVILPLTVLRRLDCVLEPTKEKVLSYLPQVKSLSPGAAETVLKKKAKLSFYNKSKFDFRKLIADPNDIAANLRNYINGFSKNARSILEHFNFDDHIERLDKSNLLYMVVKRFADVDLHPEAVANIEMGYIFEELIRKFADLSNETAGEHFTPREVIRLMVNILFLNDKEILTKKGIVKTLFDPACGTGGMLSVAEEYLRELNPDADLRVFGQELNPESYAICNSDMLIKGQNTEHIKFGNSFTQDGLKDEKFDYMLSNPPFGVEWKKIKDEITKEYEQLGFSGRFGAGLPRISDGSFLFLQHMISKMRPEDGGARLGIVFNGSPLFSGGAGSGESEIRKWIIEHDMLEAIIALPDQLFYNTGISTYIWIVTNRKEKERKGKIQLINAVEFFVKMARSLGNKRNEISDEHIAKITKIYGEFKQGEYCKIFPNKYFGYTRVTVERPLRLNFQISKERMDRLSEQSVFINLAKSKKKGKAGLKEAEEGEKLQKEIKTMLSQMDASKVYKNRQQFIEAIEEAINKRELKVKAPVMKAIMDALCERDETADVCLDKDGKPESDTELRDCENVPLLEDIDAYFKREVLPHVPDAWMDRSKDKVGYEINLTKEFYKYKPLRSLEDIRKDILALEKETEGLMDQVLE